MSEGHDEMNAAIRAAAAHRNRAPGDVVPKGDVSDAQLLAWHDAVGGKVRSAEPGQMITDPDGLPIGVEAPTTLGANLAGLVLTPEMRARLERLLAERAAGQEHQ